jgi:hypothetical protein
MKYTRCFLSCISSIVLSCGIATASDDAVTYTVQALTGLVGDTPRFEKVYCHDIYAFSGEPTSMAFICSPHFPPTNSKEKMEDHNLLSAAGIKIEGTLTKEGVVITLNATNLTVPKSLYDGTEESLIVYALECIRMTANLNRIKNYDLNVIAAAKLNGAAQKLKEKFVAHDKSKRFTSHPADEPNEK